LVLLAPNKIFDQFLFLHLPNIRQAFGKVRGIKTFHLLNLWPIKQPAEGNGIIAQNDKL